MNHTRLLLGEMLTEKALIIYMSQKMNGVFLKVVNIQKYYHLKLTEVLVKEVLVKEEKEQMVKEYKCSRCGKGGHNRRSCDVAI